MGKVKIRTLGDETLENKQKQESKQKAQEKKLAKDEAQLSGLGSQLSDKSLPVDQSTGKQKTDKPKSENRKRKTDNRKSPHSKSYQKAFEVLDRSKEYKLTDALALLEKLQRTKLADETVELHINTIEMGVSGNITLPHGTGKQVKVAIADDDLLSKVAKGQIDFDILLVDPSMMPKLARVAKILGPKGLMPNPKNATLVKDPVKAAENFKKGQMNFRTELKAPIMHLIVGKMSFGPKKLAENITALIDAIKKEKIRNVTLKSTMSPGIKLKI